MSSSNTLFQNVFSHEMISHSNLYSAQTNIEKGSIGVDKNEIERYIGYYFECLSFPPITADFTGN